MARLYGRFVAFCFLFFGFHVCLGQGQGHGPVLWRFAADAVEGNATTLYLSARLAPGWHLFSQFLKEGGPMPTRFKFHAGDDYVLNGVTRESGIASRFYDDTYEMEIIWYGEEVTFEQDIILNGIVARVKGVVEYMVCNEDMCIPGQREFDIGVRP